MGLGWIAQYAWRNKGFFREHNTKTDFYKGGTGVCKAKGREGLWVEGTACSKIN